MWEEGAQFLRASEVPKYFPFSIQTHKFKAFQITASSQLIHEMRKIKKR